MKKLICFILSLTLALSITAAASLSATAAEVKPVVTINSVSASLGDEVELSIILSGAPDLSLILFADISYDESQLKLISARWDEKGAEDYDYNINI